MSDEKSVIGPDNFMLRFPDGMRERIKIAAAKNSRSMNSEIVNTLLEEYPEVIIDPKVVFKLGEFLNTISDVNTHEGKREMLEYYKKIMEEKKLPFTIDFDKSGNIIFNKN